MLGFPRTLAPRFERTCTWVPTDLGVLGSKEPNAWVLWIPCVGYWSSSLATKIILGRTIPSEVEAMVGLWEGERGGRSDSRCKRQGGWWRGERGNQG
ncbi:hypothetical protein SLEP1_g25618 [Rubroshorea leprosula]|uniref:Uncharacterized protein n=1 Tax=Rubroshorea leprosula TaxID=152421 RepID=A0AAV5JWZ9_9ROSI|nr:hypothetical protein SLEP1_g25618 [Rubroshorea leprosula]